MHFDHVLTADNYFIRRKVKISSPRSPVAMTTVHVSIRMNEKVKKMEWYKKEYLTKNKDKYDTKLEKKTFSMNCSMRVPIFMAIAQTMSESFDLRHTNIHF